MQKVGYNFSFNQDACASCNGECCVGESGSIWATHSELSAMAKHFDLDYDVFCDKYTKKINGRITIKEKPYKDGLACIFFDNGCTIYKLRPTQCATFPFWDQFLKEPHLLCCPGVQLH